MNLTNKIKATALALGLSLLPAKEVDSGVSYGGSVAIDINRNISAGGYVASTDRTNSSYVKGGLNYVLAGRDQGKFSLRLGGGWNFRNRIAPSVELGITPKSENPFSIGVGLGYGNFKKNEKKGNVNGEGLDPICGMPPEGEWLNRGGHCEKVCEDTGGIWGDKADETGSYCGCPEGKGLGADGSCNIRG